MNDNELTEKVFSAIYQKSIYPNIREGDVTETSFAIKKALPTLRALFRPQFTELEIATAAKEVFGECLILISNDIKTMFKSLGLYTPPLSPGQQFVARINARLKAQQRCEAGGAFAEAIAEEYETEMKEREAVK